jgi:hypothetical protein
VEAAALDSTGKALSDDLLCGLLLASDERKDLAIPYLETVVAAPDDLPDALMIKYHRAGDHQHADHA